MEDYCKKYDKPSELSGQHMLDDLKELTGLTANPGKSASKGTADKDDEPHWTAANKLTSQYQHLKDNLVKINQLQDSLNYLSSEVNMNLADIKEKYRLRYEETEKQTQ